MPEIARICLDIAKNVFQLHRVDRNGKIILRKALRRSWVPGFFSALPSCLVGMEACATAHHWVRSRLAKMPFKLVAVALANKIARIAWAVMARSAVYEPCSCRAGDIEADLDYRMICPFGHLS